MDDVERVVGKAKPRTQRRKKEEQLLDADADAEAAEWALVRAVAEAAEREEAEAARVAAEVAAAAQEALQAEQEEALAGRPTEFTCGICMEGSLPTALMNHWYCTYCWEEERNYNTTVCQECVMRSVRIFVRDYKNQDAYLKNLQIKCRRCEKLITEEEVAELVPEESENYQATLTRLAVRAMDDIIYCPGVDCAEVFVKAAERKRCRKAHCNTCDTDLCGYCGELYTRQHQRMDCERYKRWKQTNDAETVQLAKWRKGTDTKDCPRCSAKIERAFGCNTVACTHCKFSFCWVCLHEYGKCEC